MSSLIKRYNQVYYVVSTERGKRVWRSTHTTDEIEARKLYGEYEWDNCKHTNLRVSAFRNEFRKTACLNLVAGTIKIYDLSLKAFERLCGDKLIRTITTYDVEKFKQLRANEVKHVTLNIDLRTLRAAFNYAKRLKLIDENPFHGVKLARLPDREAAFLTENDFHQLINTIDDISFRNIVVFAMFTMLRRGEIVNLQWADVNVDRKYLVVRNHDGFHVKGGKPRVIQMCQWVYDYLSHMNHTSQYVYVGPHNNRIGANTLTRKFKYYVRQAGLDERLHFHSLRHSGISYLLNKGVPQDSIRRLAGHSSVLTTEIYSHYEDPTLFAAVNQFPTLMRAS